jgi:hypothetical protein
MTRRKVQREHVLALNQARGKLTEVALIYTGHDELFGALSAAGAAVESATRIAMRDLDRSPIQATGNQRRKADR